MTTQATLRTTALAALALAGGLTLATPDASAFSGPAGARPAGGRMAQSSVAGANRNASANVNRNNNVNRNTNINHNNNVNINRDVDIDVDVDHGYGHWGPRYPVAAGIAIGAVAVTHAAIVGSYYYALPASGCTTVIKNGITYYYCGSVYYQRSWYGNDVVYVVVNP